MPILGRYEVQQEISRNGLNCIWSAKLADNSASAKPNFALKELRPAWELVSKDAFQPIVDSFVEQAQLQRQLTEANAKHWAPVHEVGRTASGAYFVTDHYPRSAAKLIRGRIKLSARALHHIIESVLLGLIELQEVAGRSHGNLKSSNVLIGGEGSVERARVVITDPAPLQDVLMRGGEAADLVALGELIHELVLHRPFETSATLPVAKSGSWARLGASSRAWLSLCNRLLGQEPDTIAAGLEGVQREIRALGAPRFRAAKVAAGVLGCVLILALGWGGREYYRYKRDWTKLRELSHGWLTQLVDAMGYQAKRDLLARDPHIKQTVLAQLANVTEDQMSPRRIAARSSGDPGAADSPPLSLDAMRRTRAALDKAASLKLALSQQQWPLLQQWTQRLQTDQSEQLTAPAMYLKWVLDDLDLDRNDIDLLRGINRLLYLDTRDAKNSFERLEANARQLESDQKQIEQANDPVLARFREFAAQTIASAFTNQSLASASASGEELLHSLVTRTDGLLTLGQELSAAVKSDWVTGQLDRARFASESPAPPTTAPLDEQIFRQRIEDARRYRLVPDQGKQIVQQLDSLQQTAASELNKLQGVAQPLNQDQVNQLKQRLAESAQQVEAFDQRQWVARDVQDNIAKPTQDQLNHLIADIRNAFAVSATSVEDWLKNVAKIGATHEPINQAWQQRLDALLAGRTNEQLQHDPMGFSATQKQAEAWRKALLDIDGRFPTLANLTEPFASAAAAKLKQALQSALGSIVVVDQMPSVDSAKVESIVAEFQKWQQDLSELSRIYAALTTRLDEGYGLDEKPADGKQTVAQLNQQLESNAASSDSDLAPALQPLRQRLTGLAGVSKLDATALAEIVTNPPQGQPELVVAAMRQLLSGPAPQSAAQLTQEGQFRRKIDELLSHAIKNASRRDAISKPLAQTGPGRWVQFVSSTVPADQIPSVLEAAAKSADAYGVTSDTPLPAWVSYNLLLYHTRQELASQASSKPRAELVAISRELRERIPRDVAQRPAVMSLLKSLNEFEAAPQPSGPSGNWKLTGGNADSTRTYVLNIDAETQRTLQFVAVAPPNGSPVYLCTTEFPLDLFIDLVSRDANLKKAFMNSAANTPRRGARIWELSNETLRHTWYWLPEMGLSFDLYVKDLQDPINHWAMKETPANSSPTARHPVQQISAAVAEALAQAVGCRLPTPEEWEAAYQKYELRNPAGRNLRDRTWYRQDQYIQSLQGMADSTRAALRPSAGIYLPKDFQDSGEYWDADDGTLWFRPVDADRDKTVHQLAGNVAELTADAQGHVFVIGGSALSPPKLDINKPWPVESRDACWSDVGVRLAFPVPGTELSRLRQIVDAQSFLPGPKD